ncbi:MAG: hypothetical protein CVU53_01795 [Deltaproteobacteria bacterium HGW-Deltaproteobacteria-11]|nr:MAG: hypothetical protein CVU53_01795 [Deltaproteobacteria bacterium HGW-Deltaproteobacteria-11]
MTAYFLDLLAQLPSVRAFIRNITGDIGNQRSVVVLLPLTIDAAWFWSLLDAELWRRQFLVEQVDLAHLVSYDAPAETLGETLHVRWPTPAARDIASLLSSEGLPDVIVLDGIEALESATRDAWLRLVVQWAQVSQNLVGRSSPTPVLCAILRPAYLAPITMESDVRLAVHWWWGFPSVLELKLLCRLAGIESSSGRSDTEWLEHLLPALVGNDVFLLERLWAMSAVRTDQIESCIRELAQERGWTNEKLRQWGAAQLMSANIRRNGSLAQAPPGNARILWAQGAAHTTVEYGIELHPTALYVLGRRTELDHRLWRGQAELLLPALDSIRLDICSYLTRSYGTEWPVKWFKPEHSDEEAAVRESPLACQWGYLEWLIKNCPHLSRERRWLPLIAPASRARNAIAHFRTVSRGDYEHVIEQYQRFAERTRAPETP